MTIETDQTSALYQLAGQADANKQTTDQSGGGDINVGDTSAKTSLGGGGGGSGGGGGGGAGGYSLGASIADGPAVSSSGISGTIANRAAFGDNIVNFGSGSASGGSGKGVLIALGIAAAALLAFKLWKG